MTRTDVEDTKQSKPVNEDEAHNPTTGTEPVVSPRASLLEMALDPLTRPWCSKRQGPLREIPEGIKEIDREPPRPWEAPPHAARTFLLRGGMVEVMEEEEASKQMKKL